MGEAEEVPIEAHLRATASTASQRGKRKISCEGYYFVYEKASKSDDALTFWQCEEGRHNSCRVRIHVRGDMKVHQLHQHNHGPNGARFRVLEAIRGMKENAAATHNATAIIVMENTGNLPEAAGVALPNEAALKKMIQNVRKATQGLPMQPQNLEELAIPEEYQQHNGQRFLLHDSGPAADRILIFGCEESLQSLQAAVEFFSDGTFDAAPPLFAQLLTVHVERHGFVRPLIYALLPNKTQATYNRFYTALCGLAPNMHPTRWMCDFERAHMNAVRDVFGIEPSGCLFHLGQCVYRRAIGDGLKRELEQEDGEVSLWMRCLTALAFVPVDSVAAAFANLITLPDFPEQLEPIANYFEHQWIGHHLPNGQWRQPRFALSVWNVRERTLTGSHRTNNAVEAWHRRLQVVLSCNNPQIFKLLGCLKKEQDHQQLLMQRAAAGEAPKERLKYKQSNAMVLRITQRWNVAEGGLPADLPLRMFLRGIAHHLSK